MLLTKIEGTRHQRALALLVKAHAKVGRLPAQALTLSRKLAADHAFVVLGRPLTVKEG